MNIKKTISLFKKLSTSQISQVNENHKLELETLEDRQMLSAVDIFAAGSTGEEVLQLIVHDQVVETFVVGGDVSNREFEKFSWSTDEQISADDISIRFTNDAWDPSTGLDRNLLVDKIVLDDGIHHTEHWSTNVSAAWLNGGVQSGQLRTEFLNLNAQVDFSAQSAQQFNQLDIIARGSTGDEILELIIDGQLVAEFEVSTTNQVFSHFSNENIDLAKVKIQFSNDVYLPEQSYDTNLTVESLRFFDWHSTDSYTIFTNDSSVYSTGTWTEGDGIVAGYARGNTLHTDGYFDFKYAGDDVNDQSDIVLKWNNALNEILVLNQDLQNPGYASRSMAMMNLAIHDAVAIGSGSGESFYTYNSLPFTNVSDVELAASQAVHTVLSSLYSDQIAIIDQHFAYITAWASDFASTELGRAIGDQILAKRANDGSAAIVEYDFGSGPGVFQSDPLNPNVPVWGPGWGHVDTFAVSSAEALAPQTTPPLSSFQYAQSYNEVKALGSVDSTVRTADQLEQGIFWAYDRTGLGTPMNLFNDVLESIAIQENNTFADNVELFAQASVSLADAGVVAWHSKFSEEFWRPITAIRQGDSDGNAFTAGDATWTSIGAPDGGNEILGFTPQFPTYVSGHATFGGALFGTLQQFYGTDDISFELTSRELEILQENPALEAKYGLNLDDATRTFSSFSEAQAENGRSRVYLGIHFDFDDLVGQDVGQSVASEVVSDFVAAKNEGTTLTVNAYATEPGAQFRVWVDGNVVADFEASKTTYSYKVNLANGVDPDVVHIEFLNDSYANGVDRNLVVESIQAGNEFVKTDSPEVFSTGTWTPGDGIVDGYGRGDTLNINGFFRYSV